jgi:hypothetical protein
MRKENVIPTLGLIATSLIILGSIFNYSLRLSGHSVTPGMGLTRLGTLIAYIFIFIVLRYILVTAPRQSKFRIVIDLIILFEFLGLLATLFVKHETSGKTFEMIKSAVLGVGLFVFYIWFFVSLVKDHSRKIKALTYLQLFVGLTLTVNLVSFAIPILFVTKIDPVYYFQSIQPFFIIQYIPLLFFFFKNSGYQSNSLIDS